MPPTLVRLRAPLAVALLAIGLLGGQARRAGAQFDPRKLFRGPEAWRGEEPDAGGGDERSPDAAGPPAAPTDGAARFSSGSGRAGRFGAVPGAVASFAARRVSPASPRADRPRDLGPGTGKRVVVVPIDGTIDLGLAPFVRRVLEEAGQAGDVAAVVLDVNTFGGRVDAAVQIRDSLLSSKVPTVAFVNRRAISAGALISLACDLIAVTSGATLGAATPVAMGGGGQAQPVAEKVVSYMRKEMRSTAEAKGRSGDLAEAMVDADIEVEGVSEKGKLLTLTTDEGLEQGMFDLQTETLDVLLEAMDLADAVRVTAAVNWAERVARVLTDPVVSGLLMSFGFLGILMELYTAGFGIAGILGILCLFLFFLGHVVADLAGWEEVLLFVAGLALIVMEVVGLGGGLGLLGIAGAACVVTSLVMALIEAPLDLSWADGLLGAAVTRVAIALAVTLVAAVVMAKTLPRTGLVRLLVLDTGLAGWSAAAPDVEAPEGGSLVGAEGVALTALHPFGKARIAGRRREVTSEGAFVPSGTRLRVHRVDGRRLVVRPLDGPPEPGGEEA